MALTKNELMALWQSSVDPEFARQLLEQPDSGIEVIEVSAELMAMASRAVERTSQGWFLRPWSGQTYPPAAGAAFSTVDVELSRAAPATEPVVLLPDQLFVEEEVTDFSDEGGVLVTTGRRYTPRETLVLVPGESLLTVPLEAEKPGAGYDLPLSGTIGKLLDAGVATGSEASVFPGTTVHRLVLAPEGETIPPSAVGQYIRITAGANTGQVRRIIAYEAPDPDAPHNGVAILAASLVLAVSGGAGVFMPGELAEQSSTGASLVLFAARGGYVVGDRASVPDFVASSAIVGVQSGASLIVDAVLSPPGMTAETSTADWELLDWEGGVGLSSSNPESPTGGADAVLDHIGEERSIGRSPGETDEPYRARLYARPDAISPNALIRAMNRVLAPYGLTGCLREPSDLDTFPGLFYDAPANGPESRRYAYDLDFDIRPADRYKLALDLAEFRAFFVAAIPPMSLGEFGCAFDQGFVDFFDSAPFLTFFDGFAATAASTRIAVWNALDSTREAGVGFDLVEDRFGC